MSEEHDNHPPFPNSGIVWNALVTQPGIGIVMISEAGVVQYVNDQGAHLFVGEGESGESFIGRDIHNFMPSPFVDERLDLFKQMKQDDQPRLLRSIWHGAQHFSWIQQLPQKDGTVSFLVITRRVGKGDEEQLMEEAGDIKIEESNVIDLGEELGKLSPRELEVLALMGVGMRIDDIAKALHRSPKTIESHRLSMGRKLQIKDRIMLARLANRAGLRPEDAEKERVGGTD